MKFFKYLIFIIITIFSAPVFADSLIVVSGVGAYNGKQASGSTIDAACKAFYTSYLNPATHGPISNMVGSGNACYLSGSLYASKVSETYICPPIDYPAYYYFDAGSPIPIQECYPTGDKFCVFKAKPNSIILNHANNRQSTVLYNTSPTPVASCTPLKSGQCDKNDPYGDCYQPPNDGCTRLADGSITCPDGAAPPSPTGTCSGATYCNRPPTGCGTGYVSGSFNGQALCVKSSNSGTGSGTGTGSGDGGGSGTGTGSGDGGSGTGDGGGSGSGTPIDTGTGSTNINNSGSGSGSSTGGSGGGTTSTSFTIDLSPVVRAISALSDKLTWVKSELVNAVSRVEDKLTQTNSKLDTTNSKLDSVKSSVDQTTAAVNANATTVKTAVEANTAATNGVKTVVEANTNSTANKLNEVVNAINNKPVGGGGGTTDVKPVVDAIEKQTTDFKDMMKTDSSDFDTSQYEKIGDASDDPRSLNAQSDAAGSLQALSNKLTFSNSACVQDFTVTVPIYGSMTVPLSQWCDLLALVKILLHLCTLMVAFKMLDSTVRAI
ncbi:hypothetical protein [Acinetobacter baumannii]|uniref:hypothetical protein n=1 Tax=Acinetobacter baumannii TaxID=470 RepID=UPI000BF60921|nr:hypothetical protein [Acinetobacter baumannii]MDC4523531.1 hypothetical protein [Acinetobacter baumannii]MDC5023386.1 hypothetical protein [Acinetobacter baumannii]MDN8575624.1 hypothetical protein [Acinetobacter baumannii]WCS39966.1 hypothetical protein OSV60_09150 [Acinetobacter baumannii]HCQ9958965.1 hypothetical protein [Acinetobacter baumannii]